MESEEDGEVGGEAVEVEESLTSFFCRYALNCSSDSAGVRDLSL